MSKKDNTTGIANKKRVAGARITKEEKARLMNEKKQQKEVCILACNRRYKFGSIFYKCLDL